MADDPQHPSTDYSDSMAQRRASRRGFLRTAGGVAAGTALAVAGCDSNDQLPENENPSATLSVSDSNPEVGQQVTFTVNFSDPDAQDGDNDSISSAELRFGDGDSQDVSSTGEVPHVYQESGMYTATLVVEDQYGGEGQATAEVTVAVGTTMIELDFNDPVDVLNYAYALEQLEAAFYDRAVQAIDDGDLSLNDDVEEKYFRDLTAHEKIHRDFFATAIPAVADATGSDESALPELADFLTLEDALDFGSRDQVFQVTQLLEDTGVSAYNGAGIYLGGDNNVSVGNTDLLSIAGKIVSVEARHAAAVRATYGDEIDSIDLNATLSGDLGDLAYALTDFGANAEFSLDAAQSPATVLTVVGNTFLNDDVAVNPVGLVSNPNTPGSPG